MVWVVLQPLALAAMFTIFFGELANVPSEGVPYGLFALAGLSAWLFASQAVTQAAASLVGDANLVAKVYFPRLVLPVGRILALLLDVPSRWSSSSSWSRCTASAIDVEMLLAPAFLLLAFGTAAGAGIFLAARQRQVPRRDGPRAARGPAVAVRNTRPLSRLARHGRVAVRLRAEPDGLGVSRACAGRCSVPPRRAPAPLAISVAPRSRCSSPRCIVYFRRTEHFFADVI